MGQEFNDIGAEPANRPRNLAFIGKPDFWLGSGSKAYLT
jgi:hypothetical protein